MAEFAKLLGEHIRSLRAERKLSQEKLGEYSKLSEKYISQIERGVKNLSTESLHKISIGLGVTLEELFRKVDPIQREDDLGELVNILSKRSKSDQTLILTIAKAIFEKEKREKK